MKLKRFKKIKLIILLSIILLAALSSSTLGVGSYPNHVGIDEGWGSGIYCTQHEATLDTNRLVNPDNYITTDTIHYGGSGSEAADITVAYALYLGLSGEELQNIIWASSNNTGVHVGLTNSRVINYKTVYEQIFQRSSGSVVKDATDKNNLKVLVDRIGGTYSVGPYKLDLTANGASSAAKNILLNEIRTGKKGTPGAFATFNGITGINGEIQEVVYSDGSKAPNNFPDFGREFYIRFKPKNSGAITSTGIPAFKLEFMKSVTGTVTKFDANSVDYQLTGEYAEHVLEEARSRAPAAFGWVSPTGEPGTGFWQEGTITIDTTIQLVHHDGGVINTKEESENVKVSRYCWYDENGWLHINGTDIQWQFNSSTKRFPASHHGNVAIDVQTIANVSGGNPTWTTENNRTPVIPPYTYEDQSGEGYNYDANPNVEGIKLPEAQIDMQIGGRVWLEEGGEKSGEPDGRKTNKDKPFAGIQVDLYESNGSLVTTTTTDRNGKYRFYGQVNNRSLLNPLRQYYVVFEYDGQRYQATYSYSNIASSGGFSNARDVGREEYNAKFKLISANPNNYTPDAIKPTGSGKTLTSGKRAYGIDHKIAKDNGEYATTGGKNNEGKEIALTYEDVYNKFLELSTSDNCGNPKKKDNRKEWKGNNYYSSMDELKKWLEGKGVKKEFNNIQSFIFDSLMKSSTQKDRSGNTILYPKYDRFVLRELYSTTSDDYTTTKATTFSGQKYTYLYSANYDMARYVDFGVSIRPVADIRLQKDLYKAALIVNGKKEVYEYAKRDLSDNKNNKDWDIRVRAANELYNGSKTYERDIRGSEYLLGKENVEMEKMLRVYVTYRIAFKNNGETNVKVKEIVDHYDKEGYEFNLDDRYIRENTFIGDYEGNADKSKKLETDNSPKYGSKKTLTNEYANLYLTGMDETLKPGSVSWVYVTFKVRTDEKGRIKLDYLTDPATTDKNELKVSVGKRNIAEINAYETYYIDSKQAGIRDIPNYLKKQDNKYITVDTSVAGKVAGLVDYNSNPGSLTALDLDSNGNLKVTKTSKTIEGKAGIIASDRQEDDSSQAPNIRLIIAPDNPPPDPGPDPDPDPEETRKLKGYVFEDNRTEKSEDATIGNGEYQDGEAKINGVKVELVELVSEVNDIGESTHTYIGEKVWLSHKYDGKKKELEQDDSGLRYSSGDGASKIIIDGPDGTILDVSDKEKLAKEDGQYAFLSLPAGDFFIRFTYGDDDGTTVVKTEELRNQVNELEKLQESATKNKDSLEKQGLEEAIERKKENIRVNEILGTTEGGRNAKSYNGQDYKSTVYQNGIEQSGNYYNIKAYTNSEKQNYTDDIDISINSNDLRTEDGLKYKDVKDIKSSYEVSGDDNKSKMYYYNIVQSDKKKTVSDAKDVWYYRNRSNEYSKGISLDKDNADNKILLNKRAETLAAFEKLSSYALSDAEIKNDGTSYDYSDEGTGEKVYNYNNDYYKKQQRAMLDEFEENTYMVAQTGIINTEIERDRNETEYDFIRKDTNKNALYYTVDNINLGLTERPKAQLKLNKKVDNYTLSLYSGTVLFDANKSQNNLSFSDHEEHSAEKDKLGLFKVSQPRLGRPRGANNEIIQNYIDNEFLQNILINLKYTFFVENVGETDYTDKKFYYTGIEDNADKNTSKTAAVRVVDYVANELGFSAETNKQWNISSAEQLMPSKVAKNENENFVNRLYNDELRSYKTLIATDNLGQKIKPNERNEIELQLSNQLVDLEERNNVFCNMAEIVATYNDVGRRCAFTIPGNEEMADQLLGNNAGSETRSPLERIQVKEIDADCSQEVKILPPTGDEDKKMFTSKTIGNTIKKGITSILGFVSK